MGTVRCGRPLAAPAGSSAACRLRLAGASRRPGLPRRPRSPHRSRLPSPPSSRPRTPAPLPPELRRFLRLRLDLRTGLREAEWSPEEIYLSLPRPGGDGWLSVDLETGAVEAESTDRGWISYVNDLHKGRNTGPAWRWFIDVFALACLVFALTGLVLLQLHARQRGLTWPMVGLGALVPLLIALLLIH